ncbi:hypothetical protein BV898_02911 [Hypsibius exemplaris]|uniref:Receptor ligand binding region domain-containing protein n=1 Tax=Hypsibius exemplaris TaxID=2072580 RepID=A0A1W0X6J9_HYPEX|nr:hypothetical protein BV898_02911 [Hypsibius exemplaris]
MSVGRSRSGKTGRSSYSHPLLRNRELYPNVIQAGPVMAGAVTTSVASLVLRFNWTLVYQVLDTAGMTFFVATTGAAVVGARLKAVGCSVLTRSIASTSADRPLDRVLSDIENSARIIIFWGHALTLRRFMISAHRSNMTGADYVYIFFYPYEYIISQFGNVTWQNDDEDDLVKICCFCPFMCKITQNSNAPSLDSLSRLRRTARCFANASHRSSRDQQRLLDQFVARSQRDYNYTFAKNDWPFPAVLSLYASVSILRTTLDGLRKDELSKLSGSAVLASRMVNRTFETGGSGTYTFDHAGERLINFDVRQLNLSTGTFEAVLR